MLRHTVVCFFNTGKFEKLEYMLEAIKTVQTLDLHCKEDCSLTLGSTTQVYSKLRGRSMVCCVHTGSSMEGLV